MDIGTDTGACQGHGQGLSHRYVCSKTDHFNVKIKANLVKLGRVSGPSKQICVGYQTSMNNFTLGLLLC
jgi:hypothetical protein